MIIELKEQDISLLEKVFSRQKVSDVILLNKIRNFDKITSEEIANIIDIISDELMEHGFLANSEPSRYGLQIENLLDKVNKPRLE